MNDKLGRIPFITLWVYFLLIVIVTWQEYYTVSAEDFKILFSIRFLCGLTIIPVAFYLRKKPFSVWANSFVAFNLFAYTCVGHFYRPMYFACYIQVVYALAFLFFTSRTLYYVLSTGITVGYLAFYLYTYDLVAYPQGAETKADFIVTAICAHSVGFLVHHFFTAERGLREAATDRFVLLGRHASNIIHDIKGSIAIPHMYLSEARKSLDAGDYSQLGEYLSKMEKSLSRTEKTIFDLNQLSRLAENDDRAFQIRESLQDVLDMLAKRLHDVDVSVDGDFEFRGSRGVVCSIFLNIILNSLESFKRSKTESPKIEIKINPNRRVIVFEDNGGGFSKDALSSLKKYQIAVASTSNSGLGLYLVRENLRTLKGKVAFTNIPNGASVEIKIG